MEGAPPVDPTLGRAREIPGAKDVARNTLETLLFRGLSTPVALLLVVVQSRFLAPSGRGQFVLVVLSVTILSRLLGQLGLAVTNRLQSVPATEVRPLVHRAFAIGAALGALGMAGIVAWGAATPGIGAATAAIAAAALIPNVVWQTISGVLLGQARVRLWNYIQALSPLLTLAGMLVLVVGLDGGVDAAVFAWTLAHFLTATFALVAARDLVVPVDLPPFLDRHARTILRLALVMGAVQVVNLIGYRVELFLLEYYDGVAAVGIYSIAMQAAEALWLIPAAIATAITGPVVHEAERAASARVAKAALRALAYTSGAALVVGLAAPFLIPLLFGDAFESAARPLLFLLPGVVAYGTVTVLVVYISVRRGRPRLALTVSVAAMLVTAAAAIPLIAEYGKSGAAAASSLGYLVGVVLAWLFFARLTRTPSRPS
jgi:O-antigen/teichoic acid export membrane protein